MTSPRPSWPAPSSPRWSRRASREVVLAPGSRNAPLSFAAYDAAEAGLLRLHTRIDERTAGFLALGLTQAAPRAAGGVHLRHRGRQPAPGRARGRARRRAARGRHRRPPRPAARHRRQPDHRPGRHLRPAGADSTSTRRSREPSRPRRGRRAPVHLNVQLDEPLVPDDRWAPTVLTPPRVRNARSPVEPVRAHDRSPLGPRTVVVAGDDAGPPARQLAEAAAGRCSPSPPAAPAPATNALRCYRLLLDGDARSADRAGRRAAATRRCRGRSAGCSPATTSRSSTPRRGASGPSGRSRSTARSPARRRRAGRRPRLARRVARRRPHVARQLDALLAAEPGLTPYEVAGAVSRALPPARLLVVGASSPIRDLDLMVRAYEVGGAAQGASPTAASPASTARSRRAIGAALGRRDSSRALRADGRRDVPARRQRPGARPRRAAARPDDRGRQRRRRLDLRDARAGRPGVRRPLRAGSSAPRTASTSRRSAPPTRTPHWRVESLAELEHALASPNGGIEVVEVRRPARQPPRARRADPRAGAGA